MMKNKDQNKSAKRKKKRGGTKRRVSAEQVHATNSVHEWAFTGHIKSCTDVVNDDGFGVVIPKNHIAVADKVGFEMHSHSVCSDGFLSPSKLVERAHGNGVKVLALTDHDTMAGIPEALETASRCGIKIIPGVEISTIFHSSGESGYEEPVHILAYYSCCGPKRFEELESFLANIRDGRYIRAKNIIAKLNNLKMAIKWEHIAKIAGNGVAPGRLHVARAMVEAGYVENLKQAFSRYLFDGGPAYSNGSEPPSEEAVKLISDTGGIAVLAHPWALKNPVNIIRKLTEAGLHGIEVYRSDGKLAVFSDLADTYGLVKIGGADYHARGGHNEADLGSVSLPITVVNEFLKVARPIWFRATIDILQSYIENPSEIKLEQITRFGKRSTLKADNDSLSCGNDLIDLCLSHWLTKEEMQKPEFEVIKSKLSNVSVNLRDGIQDHVKSV